MGQQGGQAQEVMGKLEGGVGRGLAMCLLNFYLFS